MSVSVKLQRLQDLLKRPAFAALIPPLVELPSNIAVAVASEHPDGTVDDLRTVYAERIRGSEVWLERVVAVCGPPPWIVRSAGLEDGEGFTNAGGYASIVCADAVDFAGVVAAVAFSGFDPLAIAQQRLADPTYQPQPISCFVQPLIKAGSNAFDLEQVPYLPSEACRNLFEHITGLHRHFAEKALDTEWVLETEHGAVSVTGLTLVQDARVRGQLAFGFGFASAQSPGQRANSVAYFWPAVSAPLWRGQRLVQVEVRKTWLVQIRPAPGYTLERRVTTLTAAARAELRRRLLEVAVASVLPAAAPRKGGFLASATLDDAWSRYLSLAPPARNELAAVFVENGVASEHAGIMFRQVGVPVYRIDLAKLPTAPSVVVDAVGERAWFGSIPSGLALHVVPMDCIDLPGDIQRVFDDLEPALPQSTAKEASIRLQNSLAGIPVGSAYAEIQRRSAWPTDCWLQHGADVRSPSLLGWLLARDSAVVEELRTEWEHSREVAWYVQAAAAHYDPKAGFPSLCAECPQLAESVSTLTDLRFAVQLTQADTWAARMPGLGLGSQANAAFMTVDGRELFECLLRTLEDTETLPIYEDADRLEIIRSLTTAADTSIAAGDLLRAARQGQCAPTALASLVRAPQAFVAYLAILGPLSRFRAAAALAGAAEAEALLESAALLQRSLCEAGLLSLSGLCRIDLVDTYDQVLKAVLTDVVARRDPMGYQRYLDLLANWIDFARMQDIVVADDAALCAFLGWIAVARRASMPDNFFLELNEETAERLGDHFLRWQTLMPIAGGMSVAELPITNAHQLHNLLHQWMLAHFRAEPGDELPQRLRVLLAIADGFGDAPSCLLRLGRSVLEISLPMVVHKASFLFTEQGLTIEFAELPDAPEDEIGRLLVFEALARRIGEWESTWIVSMNRIRNFGTWTLLLRVRRSDDGRIQAGDLRKMLIWFRVLFDAAYDFSYVPNSDVAHVYDTFGQAPWPELFRAYAAYREVVDTSIQRTTVYSLPFATSLSVLCQDETARVVIAEAYRADFDGAWLTFIETAACLNDPALDVEGWSSAYALAGQLGVLLAAMWPQRALEKMAQEPLSAIAGERISASLLHRRDIVSDLHRLITPGAAPASDALRTLALHHAPCWVVDAAAALGIAQELVGAGRTFKRCKEYLLAYYADLLSDNLCEKLIGQLDLIPCGVNTEVEACIQRALVRTVGTRGRFRLAEVDYVAIVRTLSAETIV